MKNLIYYVKRPGDGSEDDVYLVHIDPAVFDGTSWMYQQIELAVTDTPHVMVISPENYDGDITDEVTVTVDSDGNLKIYKKEEDD